MGHSLQGQMTGGPSVVLSSVNTQGLTEFSNSEHGLRSGKVTILDYKTIRIRRPLFGSEKALNHREDNIAGHSSFFFKTWANDAGTFDVWDKRHAADWASKSYSEK